MAPNEFDTFCRFAFGFLVEQKVQFLVVGGLAVVVIGEPRMTADADVIAFLSLPEAETLIGKAVSFGFAVDERLERERLATTGTLRFRRGLFQLDLITASLPFELAAYERATTHRIFGMSLPFPSPEDLILFKLLAGRDKDMLDATGIARRHRDHLDVAYLEQTLLPICDAAEDMTPWKRLARILPDAPGSGGA